MDALALLLSRLQFAFAASFHIIYHPSPLARGLGWLFSRLCISPPAVPWCPSLA